VGVGVRRPTPHPPNPNPQSPIPNNKDIIINLTLQKHYLNKN